jgi:hypothetical protein
LLASPSCGLGALVVSDWSVQRARLAPNLRMNIVADADHA